MINIKESLITIKKEGYGGDLAEAKLCQDIILFLLSKSRLNKNITIKGGVVMRSISNNVRRATVDIDLDLIKYPLTDVGIERLIKTLDGIEGIHIKIVGKIEDLKHEDYKGKRVHIEIFDSFNQRLSSKIDIGVHKYFSLKQNEYCFDISEFNEGASLLINSKEQMFIEKLKSLLRFGALSTRYKDVYDMYYLKDFVNRNELLVCFEVLIRDNPNIYVNSICETTDKIKLIFNDNTYIKHLSSSNKNWLGINDEIVLKGIVEFLESLNKR